MTNPYTHLLTLLDDESKHDEMNRRLFCVIRGTDPEAIWFGPLKQPTWQRIDCPDYTSSLDELIPLWPKGYYVEMSFDFSEGHFICHAYECKPNDYAVGLCRGGYDDDDPRGKKPTPALAMLDCLLQVLEYEWEAKNV